MSLKGVWRGKHGLTLLQRKQIDMEIAMERLARDQERAMFQAIEDEPRLLAQLDEERKAFSNEIERRITNGWRPDAHDWERIEHRLRDFAERRRMIVDPHGIMQLAQAMTELERLRDKARSTFDRHVASYMGRW